MKMRSRAHARASTITDELPFFDEFSIFNHDFMQVSIVGLKAKGMIKFDESPITPIPAIVRHAHHSISCGIDRSVHRCAQVHTCMVLHAV